MIAKALDLAAVKRRGEKKKWAALLKARLFEIKNVRVRDYWTTMLSDRSHIS